MSTLKRLRSLGGATLLGLAVGVHAESPADPTGDAARGQPSGDAGGPAWSGGESDVPPGQRRRDPRAAAEDADADEQGWPRRDTEPRAGRGGPPEQARGQQDRRGPPEQAREAQERAGEQARDAQERAGEQARDAQERAGEQARSARERAAERAGGDNGDADTGNGPRADGPPPGLEGREEEMREQAKRGSERGQEQSRSQRPWWRFWGGD